MKEQNILVVDDDKFFIESISKLLEIEGYNVKQALNGEDALKVVREQNTDLIICDIAMPGLDGFEFKASLEREEESKKIPFIFLTAYSDKKTAIQGCESGADDFIVKPYDAEVLIAKVERLLSKSKFLSDLSKEKLRKFGKEVLVNLSHEFKTPLVAITTGSELLLDPKMDVSSKNTQRILAAIHRNGKRLEDLVNDFVALQNIILGEAERKYKKNVKDLNLEILLRHFIEDIRIDLAESGFKFEANVALENPNMKIAPDYFIAALEELIDNARKFSQANMNIVFNARSEGQKVLIEIFDRGRGVSRKNLSGVFMVFSQDERKKFEQQGLGMGLSIANHYIQLHNGTLNLENREDGGVVAKIVLPQS